MSAEKLPAHQARARTRAAQREPRDELRQAARAAWHHDRRQPPYDLPTALQQGASGHETLGSSGFFLRSDDCGYWQDQLYTFGQSKPEGKFRPGTSGVTGTD